MKRFAAGEAVVAGTYMNLATGQFLSFEGPEKSILPTAHGARYARIPLGLVFVLGPLMGLAYIIFLPLAGIGSLVVLGAYKLRGGIASLTPRHAKD